MWQLVSVFHGYWDMGQCGIYFAAISIGSSIFEIFGTRRNFLFLSCVVVAYLIHQK